MRLFTWVFLIISSFVFLAHYLVIGQAVYGDGRFYYSYARSLAIEGNLDIKDELTHIYSSQFNNTRTPAIQKFTGYPVQSLGPALFWTPIIFLANIVARPNGLTANGYSDIYQLSVGLFSILLSAVAFEKIGRFLLKKYKPLTVFFTLFLTWTATNLFFYTAIDTVNTHFFSFSLAAIALLEYLDNKKPSLLLTGILAGLAFQNRQMDIIYHLSFFLVYFSQKRKITDLLTYTAAGFIAILPQIYVWHLQFGSYLPPLTGAKFWQPDPVSFVNIIFNLPNGLLFTAPIMVIASLFLPSLFRNRYIKWASVSFLLTLIVLSFWFSPTGGASYGQRFLLVFFPLFSLSLAKVLSKISSLKVILFTLLLTALSLVHTFIFLLISP